MTLLIWPEIRKGLLRMLITVMISRRLNLNIPPKTKEGIRKVARAISKVG